MTNHSRQIITLILCSLLAACGGSGSSTLGSGGLPAGGQTSDNGPAPSQPNKPGTPTAPVPPDDSSAPPAPNDPSSPTTPPDQEEPITQDEILLFAGEPSESRFMDGTGTQAGFQNITQIESDANGNLYVVDSGTIRRITPAGEVITLAGAPNSYGFQDGQGAVARFGNNPDPNTYGYGRPRAGQIEIAVAPDGDIYVLDRPYIRRLSPEGEVTTILDVTERGMADGPIGMARFLRMRSIEVDGAGNIYIEDETGDWGSIAVRRISPDGIVSTIHTGCLSQYAGCFDLNVDAQGRLYFMHQRIPASAGSARSLDSPNLMTVGQDGQFANGPAIPVGHDYLNKVSILDIDSGGSIYFSHLRHEGIAHATYPIGWQITKSENFLKKLRASGETIIIRPFTKEHGTSWNAPVIDAEGRTLPALENSRPITVTSNGDIFYAGPTFIAKVVTPH